MDETKRIKITITGVVEANLNHYDPAAYGHENMEAHEVIHEMVEEDVEAGVIDIHELEDLEVKGEVVP